MKRAVAIAAVLILAGWAGWLLLWGEEPAAVDPVPAAQVRPVKVEAATVAATSNGAGIGGRVVRRGAGVVGARVTFRGAGVTTILTDANGAFALEGLEPGESWLSAALDDEASALVGPLVLAPAERRNGVILELLPSAAVAGRVVDSQTRQAIAGAQLVTSGGSGTSDHDGRFTLHGLPAGQTWIEASAAGHLSRLEWISLESARAHTGFEISLDPASSVSGLVKKQGLAVAGATVWAERLIGSRVGSTLGPTVSGPAGAWKLAVSPGLLRVMGQLPDGTRIQGPHIRVEAGEDREGVDLEAGETLGVDGLVRLDGQPLPGATLTLFDSRSSEVAAVTTSGPSAQFHFERVPVGRYLVQVRRGALSTQTGPYEQSGEGQSWNVDISGGAALAGHVEPKAAGVRVRWRSGDWAGEAANTLTDAQGAFRFEGVGTGVLLVEAEGEQGSAAARATAGTTDLVLTLAKGRLKVTVQDDRGGAVTDFSLTLVPQSGGLVRRFPVLSPSGTFSLELPAGAWRVEATANGYADATPQLAEVRTSEAEVRLQLNPAVPLRGVVRDAVSRLPIRGAQVSILRLGGPPGQQFRFMGRTSAGVTDGNGEFYAPAVALAATLEVRHPLYNPVWQMVPGSRDGTVRVELLMQPGKSPPQGERILEYEGVGMQLQGDPSRVFIAQVYEGSPAESAGLQAGDQIILVDSAPAAVPVENTVKQIQGPAGSVVKLTIRRGAETLEFSVRRRAITL